MVVYIIFSQRIIILPDDESQFHQDEILDAVNSFVTVNHI